jgi:hypothetical protein
MTRWKVKKRKTNAERLVSLRSASITCTSTTHPNWLFLLAAAAAALNVVSMLGGVRVGSVIVERCTLCGVFSSSLLDATS